MKKPSVYPRMGAVEFEKGPEERIPIGTGKVLHVKNMLIFMTAVTVPLQIYKCTLYTHAYNSTSVITQESWLKVY